jgi:ADP-ribose pyrophosphatase
MSIEWHLISQDEPVKFGRRKLQRRIYKMPDNTEREFTVKCEEDSVAIFAVTEARTVLIAKQFRPGPGRILHDLPGGLIDKGETPEAAALRELREETGFEPSKLELLGTYPADALSTRTRHAFLATGCRKAGELELDPGEFVELVEISLAKAVDLVLRGEMTDTPAALLSFRRLGV